MEPEHLARAVDVLRRGGVVAYPTDTLYGLAVDPRRDDAVEKLYALKGRPAALATPLIAANLEQAQRAGVFAPGHLRLAGTFWPGPLSIVVPAEPALSSRLLGEQQGRATVAIRVPAHALARALAAAFGFCITSTSANLSGWPAPSRPEQVTEQFAGGLDYLLDGGPSAGGAPSTIVRLDDGVPILVREGAVAWSRVLKSIE